MRNLVLFAAVFAVFMGMYLLNPQISPAQLTDSIRSEHVRLRIPVEREWLGRDVILNLEHCYEFMSGATGANLPRRILVIISWKEQESSCNLRDASITLGMNQPATAADSKSFLMHQAAREMAHLGLLELSRGAEREDNKFLFEGMIEILAREYTRSSHSMEAAWLLCRLLDEMQLLGLASQRSWSSFSGGRRSLRSSAPGITFLTTFRELYGRDQPLKFFESLRRSGPMESLAEVFKAPVNELESIWLKRVREYQLPEELSLGAGDVPQLVRTAFVPAQVRPGSTLQVRMFLSDDADNLTPDGVFVKDERTGRVLQAQASSEKNPGYLFAVLTIEENCTPGRYNYRIIAIDEIGNIGDWKESYEVMAP